VREKYLIFGGSGLLGVNWAIQKRVTCDIFIGLNKRVVKINGVSTFSIDFADHNSILRSISELQPDVVVNAAGLTSVEVCENYPQEAHNANVEIARKLAIAAHHSGAKMVHISTDHLYQGVMPSVDEETLPEPVNQYGITKWKAEQVVLEACPNALVIRTNFYGWGPKYRQSFTDFIISHLRAGKIIRLFEDVYYSPILISVLVNTIHELIIKGASGIFNVVGDERVSKLSFGKKVAEIFSLDQSLILSDSFAKRSDLVKRPLDMSLSNAKVVSFLGKPLGTMEEHLLLLKEEETKYYQEIIQL